MARIYIGSILPGGGGGGVSPNPTSGFMPVQLLGAFQDSLIQSTDDQGNSTSIVLDDFSRLIQFFCGSSTILMNGSVDDIRLSGTNGINLDGGVFINNHLGNAILRFLSNGASHPALKANGNVLQVRLANDSADADLTARNITSSAKITTATDFQIVGKSQISSLVDSNLTLYNAGKTAFNLLQFGGITASFPALKRNATEIQVRLADDSQFANIRALLLITEGALTSTNTSLGFRCNNTATNIMLLNLTTGLNINLGGASTNVASAILQADSTTKGFLVPRMTDVQRLAIVSPAIGLQVYQTNTNGVILEGLYIFKSTGWTFIV